MSSGKISEKLGLKLSGSLSPEHCSRIGNQLLIRMKASVPSLQLKVRQKVRRITDWTITARDRVAIITFRRTVHTNRSFVTKLKHAIPDAAFKSIADYIPRSTKPSRRPPLQVGCSKMPGL
jgi:hypothetical protein